MTSPSPLPLHPAGHLIGSKYRVEAVLEPLADAVVYACEETTGRTAVSVKVLAAPAHPERASRFLQEARAASAIHHPAMVPVIDQGQEPDGTLFLVQPRQKGTLLRDWMERRDRLPVRGALEIAVPLLAGLATAHAAGAVHGHITPETVLLFDAGRDPLVPHLFDFGVGALSAAPSPYRSPEQLQSLPDVDGRTDVSSMAVVLYQMLAGAVPFAAATAEELAAQIVAARPVRLADRCPDVPRDLSDVIHRGLVGDRELRPLNVRFFLEALLACGSLPAFFGGVRPEEVFEEFLHYRGHGGGGAPFARAESKPEWEQKLEQQARLERAGRDQAAPASAPPAAASAASAAAGASAGSSSMRWVVVAVLALAALAALVVLLRR